MCMCARSYVTWVHACMTHPYEIHSLLHTPLILYLPFISFFSPSLFSVPDFFNFDHSPSSFTGLFLCSFLARFLARVPSFPFLLPSLSLSRIWFDLSYNAVHDVITCRRSLAVSARCRELRRRVSLQSTTLLGRRLSSMIGALHSCYINESSLISHSKWWGDKLVNMLVLL